MRNSCEQRGVAFLALSWAWTSTFGRALFSSPLIFLWADWAQTNHQNVSYLYFSREVEPTGGLHLNKIHSGRLHYLRTVSRRSLLILLNLPYRTELYRWTTSCSEFQVQAKSPQALPPFDFTKLENFRATSSVSASVLRGGTIPGSSFVAGLFRILRRKTFWEVVHRA